MNFVLHHHSIEVDIETNNYPLPWRLCRNMKKPTLGKGGEAVGWKRFRAVTFEVVT